MPWGQVLLDGIQRYERLQNKARKNPNRTSFELWNV